MTTELRKGLELCKLAEWAYKNPNDIKEEMEAFWKANPFWKEKIDEGDAYDDPDGEFDLYTASKKDVFCHWKDHLSNETAEYAWYPSKGDKIFVWHSQTSDCLIYTLKLNDKDTPEIVTIHGYDFNRDGGILRKGIKRDHEDVTDLPHLHCWLKALWTDGSKDIDNPNWTGVVKMLKNTKPEDIITIDEAFDRVEDHDDELEPDAD